MTVAFRDAEPDDRAFIVSAWARAFKPSNSAGMIASDDWESIMHPQIEKVLARPDARALVAHEKSDPSFLYGFIAGDTRGPIPVVFFAYVKSPYRRSGIGRGLFGALGVDPTSRFLYTCWTPAVRALMDQYESGRLVQASKIPYAKFDPHIARYPKPVVAETARSTTWKR